MLKNIIFDCSDTLLHFGGIELMEAIVGNRHRAENIYCSMLNHPTWGLCDEGKADAEDLARDVLPLLDEADRDYGRIYIDKWMTNYSVIDGIPELLADIKAKGCKLYLLSDFPDCFNEVIKQFPFFDLFDGMVVSYAHGTSKRSGGLFTALLETYSLKAEECLFVDDLAQNTSKAEKLGMKALLFTDADAVRRYLKI